MNIPAITFDCAQTLIEVNWNPASLTCDVARACGADLDEQVGAETYQRMLAGRWAHFQHLNRHRSIEVCDAFWAELARDWLNAMNLSNDLLEPMMLGAEEKIYGRGSEVFRVFDDVVPTLESLKAKGIRMAVLSNWDVSLHKVLRRFELTDYFDVVIASLEEGIEKPDPALFQIALDRLGVEAEGCVHVGDSPLDDLTGARNAGMKGILLDRSLSHTEHYRIATLADLEEALGI